MGHIEFPDRQAVMDGICVRLAAGESLRAICRTEGMPAAPTVLTWVREDELLAKQYARAREIGCDLLADEILEIADKSKADNVQCARLSVDARKWILAKQMPKKYGDQVDVSVGDAGALAGQIMAFIAAARRQDVAEGDVGGTVDS